jgi:hypothetical protein
VTAAGWVFLVLAWGAVIGLAGWCLSRVWRSPPPGA